MIRRILVIFLIGVVLASGFPVTSGAVNDDRAKLKVSVIICVGSPNAYVNDQFKQIDPANTWVTPVVKAGTTLVPIRFLAENFGAQVNWNKDTQTAVIQFNNKTATLVLNSPNITIDGAEMPMGAPCQFIGGRIYLPLRPLVENILEKQLFYSNGLIQIGEAASLFNNITDKAMINKVIYELKSQPGNTTANLNDFGDFVRKGDWIYYSEHNNKGDYNDDFLYKMNVRTQKRVKLLQGHCIYGLNIEGDWIYYLAEFPDKNFHQSFAIYKIKTDGSRNTKLTKAKDEEARYMMVHGGWIYYDNWQDNEKLYRMKIDGTSKQKLADIPDAWSISVQGNWVYFVKSNGRGICRVRTDGSCFTDLVGEEDWPHDFEISSEWIYYQTINGIEKIRTDGTGQVMVRKFADNHDRSDTRLHVQGEYLYYALSDYSYQKGTTTPNIKIYRAKTDGTGEKIITDTGVTPFGNEGLSDMFLVGDTIYYTIMKKYSQTYSIKTDGTGKKLFSAYPH